MDAQRRPKTGGRRKGTPHKDTATARENIIADFTRLGGADAMAEPAGANPTEFHRLYARRIPAQGERHGALTDLLDPVRAVAHVSCPYEEVSVRVVPQWQGVARAKLQ